MLIIALVLAVIGLAALVFAVVTSSELVAWVCIGASVLGVLLLIVDALQDRQRRVAGAATGESAAPEQARSTPGDDEPGSSAAGGTGQDVDPDSPPDAPAEDDGDADSPPDAPAEDDGDADAPTPEADRDGTAR
ncbi:hypothetical protein [Mycobacterium sp.]|uniref:hypothetical protein n=1 Tax=Mycobacterium sp. TaxID=1785 RepID=UPI0031D20048